ncbi:type II secretion system F family protein [Luethyella okanaganae]|uniref:Type II secretion system F family protein n=1 Tax=Luethyella okanaganae TaxID=69372 RepID=A0ABW1VDB2_9MICO
MTIAIGSTLLGSVLGAGVLLASSPWLWPKSRSQKPQRRGAIDRWRTNLRQAGLGVVPLSAFVFMSVMLGVAFAALAHAFLGVVALSVALGMTGVVLPAILVRRRAATQRRANRAVWPDVVDHLVAAVRSGLALPESVSSLARLSPPFTRAAFAAFERDYRSSGNFGQCLDRLKATLADPVADRILETLRMARDVGGSELTTVLRALGSYLRQDAAARAEVRARQSWIVNAARLGVVAPWIVLLLLSSRPEAALAYNTPQGATVVGVGLIVSVFAYRVMLAVGRLPEEQRWFE